MPSLLLSLLGLVLPALATGEQVLLYDLSLDGQRVGTRHVTLRSLQAEDGGEVRVIESYTELEASIAGQTLDFANRATARVETATTSFTSSVSEGGQVREVQARQRSDGTWKVTVIEGSEVKQATLPRGQVDLSSMQLLDPVAHRELTARARASVLAVETGTLFSGLVEDLGEGQIELSDGAVSVHRWAWSPSSLRMELAWSQDGVLVAYDSQVLGRTVQARLRQVPAARSYGDIELVAPVIDQGLAEQEL